MRVLIVGGGKVGSYLASLLLNADHSTKVIECREEIVKRIERDLPQQIVVHGSGTNPTLLDTAGAREAHVVAAVTGADETNLVVASLARFESKILRIIARISNSKNA